MHRDFVIPMRNLPPCGTNGSGKHFLPEPTATNRETYSNWEN
jgi:hypothetical protein